MYSYLYINIITCDLLPVGILFVLGQPRSVKMEEIKKKVYLNRTFMNTNLKNNIF